MRARWRTSVAGQWKIAASGGVSRNAPTASEPGAIVGIRLAGTAWGAVPARVGVVSQLAGAAANAVSAVSIDWGEQLPTEVTEVWVWMFVPGGDLVTAATALADSVPFGSA
jgi:hypothetical protein